MKIHCHAAATQLINNLTSPYVPQQIINIVREINEKYRIISGVAVLNIIDIIGNELGLGNIVSGFKIKNKNKITDNMINNAASNIYFSPVFNEYISNQADKLKKWKNIKIIIEKNIN